MNAIILAAGMGTRIPEISKGIPKGLIEINGEKIIERQIRFLNEIDIIDISIVVGYKAEKFKYLIDKYNIKLIMNNEYREKNNIFSMYLARDQFQNTFVLESDIYMKSNFLIPNPSTSMYFAGFRKDFINEWEIIYDNKSKVRDIKIGNSSGIILGGVSFWEEKDCKLIKKEILNSISKGNYENKFWDEIPKNNINSLNCYLHKIKEDDWWEIDTLEDLNKLIK